MALPPNVTPAMLDAAFWIERALDPDTPLLAEDQIAEFNARVYDTLAIPPILDLPDALPRAEVETQMRGYLPDRTLYDAMGNPLEPEDFETVLASAMPDLPDPVPVRFGMATQRTDVRAFPSAEVITSRPFEYALDRIQETTIDIGWSVAVLAASRDDQWLFCLTPHYWGWVRAGHVALGSRAEIDLIATADPFVTTLASRGLVSSGANGGMTPQMGTRLPCREANGDLIEVTIPQRTIEGRLGFARGFVLTTGNDFGVGLRPLTIRTLFEQAFKLLGERYAWGGSRLGIFGRDCSRLVQDVYAVTGIRLPRNGDQQEAVCVPRATFSPDMSGADRTALLVAQTPPGALLTLPGHVMLYLGHVDGVSFALHATSSGGYDHVIISDLSLSGERGSLLRRLDQASTVNP